MDPHCGPLPVRSPSRRGQRGSAREGAVLSAGVLVVLGLLWLLPEGRAAGASRRSHPAVPDSAALLAELMAHGPSPGTWRIEGAMGRFEFHLAEDPTGPEAVFVATPREGRGEEPGDEQACRVRRMPRERVARWLVGGPAGLFFANYRPAGRPSLERQEGRRPLHRFTWVPIAASGGETARHVWIDADAQAVVRWEDRNRSDHLVRRVQRVAGDVGPLARPVADSPACDSGLHRPFREEAPADARRLAATVPFAVPTPAYLPPGFALVHARRLRIPVFPVGEDATEAQAGRWITVAFQQLTDGLATIQLAAAPASEMDLLEGVVSRMREPSQGAEPACPPLPEFASDLVDGSQVVRRRRDRCRTVLRVDAVYGVSVSLLAHNELPEEEYLAVIASLVPAAPAEAKAEPQPEGTSGR